MTPLPLTIVTITKDDPDGLARTLSSTAKLREAGCEHLAVDGTTSGNSESVAVAKNFGVTVLRDPGRGIAHAFNVGIEAARREWVWCLNGGDRVDPMVTPESLATLLSHSRANVIIAAITYEGERAPRPHPPSHLRWPPTRSWIPHPSTLVRRRLFEQCGLFDERYTIAMDYEWWLRAVPTGIGVEVVNLPMAVFAPGGLSQRREKQATIRREQHNALRKHRSALGLSRAALSVRWCKAWWVAQMVRYSRRTRDAS